jgi:hypothetical protein
MAAANGAGGARPPREILATRVRRDDRVPPIVATAARASTRSAVIFARSKNAGINRD